MSGFVVQVRCTVIKEVICEGCTEDQARKDPFEFAVDEIEMSQDDWGVISVEAND